MGLSDDNVFNMLLYSVGGIVFAIIMIGSIFLIYNAFNISLNERTHQFGILSSVGATAKLLRNSVLFEGLCIGAAGIPIGVIVGIGSIGLSLVLSIVLFISASAFVTNLKQTSEQAAAHTVPAEEYTGQNAKMIAVAEMAADDQTITMFKSPSMNVTISPEMFWQVRYFVWYQKNMLFF